MTFFKIALQQCYHATKAFATLPGNLPNLLKEEEGEEDEEVKKGDDDDDEEEMKGRVVECSFVEPKQESSQAFVEFPAVVF